MWRIQFNSAASTEENNIGGKLIVDATCAPAEIRIPIDISLLNEAREKQMTSSTNCNVRCEANNRDHERIATSLAGLS